LGGLALFLFGMEQMSESLKAVAGERMKSILSRLTSNRLMGAITGAFVTAVIQSSSVTTVLVVGFITAGLMSLSQSIGIIMGAKYLDEELLSTPSLALDRARLEILHLGDLVMEMMRQILPAMLSGEREDLKQIAEMDDGVDLLHGQIVTYLGKISRHSLTEEQTAEFLKLMETTNDLENIGDIIETNLVMLGNDRIEEQVSISEPTQDVIREFHGAVIKALVAAMQAATQKSEEAANVVIEMKGEINRLADSAALHQARRLVAEEPNRLPAYTVEMDILQNLKRIYYFAKRMARLVVPSEDLRQAF